MPIEMSCDCGKRFSIKDEWAGKTVRCKSCGRKTKIEKQPTKPPALVDPERRQPSRPRTTNSKPQSSLNPLSSYQQAARVSWIAPIIAVFIGVFAQNSLREANLEGETDRVASISLGIGCLLISLIGFCAGFYGLVGGIRERSIRLLFPSLIGILLCGAYLTLAVIGFFFVREMAQHRQTSIIHQEAIELGSNAVGQAPTCHRRKLSNPKQWQVGACHS